jgi:hypothetical protein
MGYSHYYDQKRSLTTKEWNDLVDATHLIIFNAKEDGIVVKNGMGEKSPDITAKEIVLNGDASMGLDYETFAINKKKGERTFGFCKTNRNPYDKVVVSILNYLKINLPDAFDISSDGGDEAIDDAPYYNLENVATGFLAIYGNPAKGESKWLEQIIKQNNLEIINESV